MRMSPFCIIDAMAKNVISGSSCSSGFKIKIKESADAEERTCHVGDFTIYNQSSAEKTVFCVFMVLSLCYFSITWNMDFYKLANLPLLVLIRLVESVLLLVSSRIFSQFILFFLCPERREWHACEHASIHVLMKNDDVTTDNLKKYPKVSLLCGSIEMVISWQLFLSFSVMIAALLTIANYAYAAISSTTTISNEPGPYLLIPTIGPTIFFCLNLLALDSISRGNKKTLYCCFPALIFPLMCEYFFALKEPSDDKIEITAKIVGEFKNSNKDLLIFQ